MSFRTSVALGLVVLAGVLFTLLEQRAQDASDAVLCAQMYARARTAPDTAQVDRSIANRARGSGGQTRSAAATCGQLRRESRSTDSRAVHPDTDWKTLTSRSGWSVTYPPDWSPASCQSCPDPTAPGVFVSFGGLADEGRVMIELLESRPDSESVARWLQKVAKAANLNPIESSRTAIIDDLPALEVRYQVPNNSAMETVYLVDGRRTFEISINGQHPNVGLDTLPSYTRFRRMATTFRVTH